MSIYVPYTYVDPFWSKPYTIETRPAQSSLSVLKWSQEGLDQLTFQFGCVTVGPYDHSKPKLRPYYHMIPFGVPEEAV